jgi:quinoprotein glucose dehydrogenase
MSGRRRHAGRQALAGVVFACALACGDEAPRPGGPPAGWPVYGGDAGGSRYSPLDELGPANVGRLELAWEYHTGDLPEGLPGRRNHAFQATPILMDGTLFFCTPRSLVVALDAETGAERWVFDPRVDLRVFNLNCRGVASWRDPGLAPAAPCAARIFAATADARLFALDAASGRPCAGFGAGGSIDFSRDVPFLRPGEYGITAPPVVVGDVVVVGSSVAENRRVDMPGGEVQAFDARSGARRWRWDPIPRDPRDPARASWEGASADRTGAANVWSVGSADPERDLVFLPTSSPSPDFYGGERLGENRWADSVVALRGSTGELVWAFQTVHHDLWDYDLAAQPVLLDLPVAGRSVPAVAQATKTGHLFLLHRETGEPLVPVHERPVPQTTVPGERTAATQPFPEWPPPLAPQRLGPEDAWGLTPWDRARCREAIAAMRSEGVFTPPSLEGSVVFPGTAGGSNWGSVAWDPGRRLLVANTTRVANTVRLLPRAEPDPAPDGRHVLSTAAQEGTPYKAVFGVLLSPWGIPCNAPPWGALAALDLETRELRWEVPLGTTRDLAPLGIAIPWGVPNMGGPIATAGGLVFVAATLDDYLRAFDVETGDELWRGRLPAGGQATPMTYRVRENGRQYVVVAAGGHASMRTRRGDSLVAFALP